jgi:hypothetical protein
MTYTATNTLATLIDRLSQNVGDYLSEVVTTAITTNTNLVCTTLANYTNRDRQYERFWAYIVDKANAGVYRKVSTSMSSGIVTCLGANFTSDVANLATFQLHKYDRLLKIRAINGAARETFPNLFKYVEDITLTADSDVSEYTLPDALQNPLSTIDNVFYQTSGEITDHVHDCKWSPVYNYKTRQSGTTRMLVTSSAPDGARLLVEGTAPLEDTLSATTDTLTLVDPYLTTFIEYASYRLFTLLAGSPTGEDRDKILERAAEHLDNYRNLLMAKYMRAPQAKPRLKAA